MMKRSGVLTLLLTFVAGGCLARGDAGAENAASVRLEVPLVAERIVGAAIKSGEIELLDSVVMQTDDSDCIVLEAENYDDIYWQQVDQDTTNSESVMDAIRELGSKKSNPDPDASGGQCLERVSSASYPFFVSNTGTYTVWMRLWRPNAGGWVFKCQVDDMDTVKIVLDAKDLRQWYWQKVGTYDLSMGSHTFIFGDLHNGKKIDKIVFHRDPDFVPDGVGPDATRPGRIDKGTVVFNTYRPSGNVTWRKIHLPRLNNKGSVIVEYSFDDGKNWTVAGGDFLLPSDVRAESLKVRLLVETDPDGRNPRLGIPSILLDADRREYPVLENDRVRYTFSRRLGAIAGMELLNPHTVLMPGGVDNEVFALTVAPDVEGVEYRADVKFDPKNYPAPPPAFRLTEKDFHAPECEVGASSVTFDFKAREYPIAVKIAYTLNARGYLDAVIDVKNDHVDDILEVEFPKVGTIRVGGDSRDDTLIWPAGTGKKYVNPTTQGSLAAGYPHAVVCYFDLYDSTAGFYMGSHDPELVSTDLIAVPDASRTWMQFAITKKDRIRAKGGKISLPLVMGVHHGDWHIAATWYKAWFDTVFGRAVWPEWTKECDGWHFANISFSRPHFHFDWLPDFIFRKAIRLGLIHAQIWGTDTANSCNCYYYPPDDVGGPAAFAAANKWWKDRGGVVGYYVLPQGPSDWHFHDRSKDHFGTPWQDMPDWACPPGKKEGKSWEWAIRHQRYDRPDRRPHPGDTARWDNDLKKFESRVIGTFQGAEGDAKVEYEVKNYPWGYIAMSMYSEWWRDWLTFWVCDKYVRDWHCRAVYLDTYHTGGNKPDYNPYLGLHGDGRGGYLRSQLAKRIRDVGLKYDPMWLPVLEMQCDAYQVYMAQQVGSSSMDSEMMKFTHPDHMQYEGQTGAGWGAKRFKRFNSCWMYGNRLDHREPEGWAVEIIRMRQWITRWINEARFMDDLGLEIDDPRVTGRIHRVLHANGSRGFLVNFWNTVRREHFPDNSTIRGVAWHPTRVSVKLSPLAEIDGTGTKPEDWIPERAVLIDMNRKPQNIHFDVVWRAGVPHVEFMLPARQVNGVLFVKKAEGPQSFLARVDQRHFKQTDVHIFNPGVKTLKGTVSVKAEQLRYKTAQKTYTVEPGELVTLSFEYADGRPPVMTELVLVDIEANGAKRQIRAGAYPFMDDPSFEVGTIRHDYDDSVAFDGKHSVKAAGRKKFSIYLEGNTKYKIGFMIRGAGAAGGGTLLYDGTRGPQSEVDGTTLRFQKGFSYAKDEWRKVEFTFLTPEMYYDGTVDIRLRGKDVAHIDDMRIEVLPDDAKVEYVPNTVLKAKK